MSEQVKVVAVGQTNAKDGQRQHILRFSCYSQQLKLRRWTTQVGGRLQQASTREK